MLQDLPLLATLVLATAVGAMFALLFASLRKSAESTVSTVQPASIRLRPMARLLQEADFEFLAKQPGYRPEIARNLRRRRLEIFQTYLSYMGAEFHRLHRILRIMALTSAADRGELSKLLVEQRLLFTVRMFQVRLRLTFFRFGWKPVDVTAMVDLIEELRLQVDAMQDGFAPAGA